MNPVSTRRRTLPRRTSWIVPMCALLSLAAGSVSSGAGQETVESPGVSGAEVPGAAQTHVRLGLALRDLDRDGEAIEAFRQALAIDPADAVALINLGSLLAEQKNEESLELLSRVVEANPEDSWALYEYGEALQQFGRWAEALVQYERVVAVDPAHENARVGAAESLLAVGRLAESLTRLEETLALFPDSRGARFGLAWLLAASPALELRDGDRALALSEELFSERRSLGALELVAAARAESGRCDEALQIQRSVVSESLHHDRPAEVTARLARTAEWLAAQPCRIPPDRPADERPRWPRSRPAEATDAAVPVHDH